MKSFLFLWYCTYLYSAIKSLLDVDTCVESTEFSEEELTKRISDLILKYKNTWEIYREVKPVSKD
jgi:hypothetical protein